MKLVESVNNRVRRVPAWSLYVLAVIPPVWWFYLGVVGELGFEPIKALEHELGELALQVLIAGLAITPLRRLAGINLTKFRRALGLIAFFYVLLHLMVWLFLDVQNWGQIWNDIIKRPYITIGMAGFLLIVPLAVTSNDMSLRRLGALAWRRLHRLVYPAVILAAVHNIMVQKFWESGPLFYATVIAALLGWRLYHAMRMATRRRVSA